MAWKSAKKVQNHRVYTSAFSACTHALHFGLRVFEADMGVGVQRNADVAVAHDVLQRFGIHPVLSRPGAEHMPADMGRDLRQLHRQGPGILFL